MTEQDHKTIEQAKAEGKYIRTIKSFVKREGRLTKGQQAALDQHWSTMGLEHAQGLVNFEQVFGNNNPVVLEIGFGMGASLVEMAKNAPDKNFVGIEVHLPGVGACLSSANEAGVDNLKVYEHDAVEILRDCIADQSIDTIQLFFPDPWHKTRHHKRRIVQSAFVQSLRSKLKIGGVFHMATDWENYAEHMIEVMDQEEGFINIASDINSDENAHSIFVERPEHRPLTKFEQRGHRLGHGVWDIMYKRVS
ncbi:tRNA (guanosine(46)-N7)-methyltransferase TrmB [Psychrosphaera sp. B3R10]|uniref:tRNA (guanosine(46)-N7)-methyltransferase TrmB n=1 Tax=unclassified Psychrosphaera TaxID=2641570 RepID=UPI001C09071B|nr:MULTISPECIES: tRNA (guanosine(46)-N7)-methyltransferase TrmB [unclassified Psychrosphaera]MBU2882483.1 tRNA (guanosine(46)-N7)-methyltransferase TrmB [Psychrosphaera sp. I2R16]MBU2990304.1 tRNA (guanosine(46)-N7)-methyltransferase TrmB [Psychrosphaera sp. B3R10]MDO6718333.1 tRNA (guanosine(46)-N7)-methyltransferase TrmB [Psychrosphaera sp. 1_MG-2023]